MGLFETIEKFNKWVGDDLKPCVEKQCENARRSLEKNVKKLSDREIITGLRNPNTKGIAREVLQEEARERGIRPY